VEATAYSPDVKVAYTFNFTKETSREVSYHQSDQVKLLLRRAVRLVKKSDMGIYEQPFKKKGNTQN
jgi:hypothetical protein